MEVPAHFGPRDYQAKFLADIRDRWFVVMEWARRAGKGLTTFVYAAQRMVEEPMGVVIVYPTAEQGYRSFWNNIENDGFKTIEHIPPELRSSFTSTKDSMSMVLKNGSTLDLLGSNADPEKFRGNNIKLFILSEFVDIDSRLLDIIEPIVIANGGQIIIESTPKIDGISGATFLKLFKAAETDPEMYAGKVYGREYLSQVQLDRARKACIAKWGNDFMYRQEYELDEGQALETAYYANIMSQKEKAGGIGKFPYNSEYPVYTAWDLGGGSDSTAGVFFQYYDKKLRVIDSYETSVVNDQLLVNFIKSKPYNYAWHFFPHDGAKRDSDGVQRISKLHSLGLPNSSLLTRRRKEAALIDAIELMLKPTTVINQPFTLGFREKVNLYKKKWNPHTGDYIGPDHTTASHYSDAWRYVSDAIKQYFRADGSFVMSPVAVDAMPAYLEDDEINWDI